MNLGSRLILSCTGALRGLAWAEPFTNTLSQRCLLHLVTPSQVLPSHRGSVPLCCEDGPHLVLELGVWSPETVALFSPQDRLPSLPLYQGNLSLVC